MKVETGFYQRRIFYLMLFLFLCVGPGFPKETIDLPVVLKNGRTFNVMAGALKLEPYLGEKSDDGNQVDEYKVVSSGVFSYSGPDSDLIVLINAYSKSGLLIFDGFCYYKLSDKKWKLVQVETLGEGFQNMELFDLIDAGKKQLIFYSLVGANSTKVNVFKYDGSKFSSVFEASGYGGVSSVEERSGKPILISYRGAFVGAAGNSTEIFREVVCKWNGERFEEVKDDFVKCLDLYDSQFSTDKKEEIEKIRLQSLKGFDDYLKKSPNDFDAIANCWEISNNLGKTDQATSYFERLKKIKNLDLESSFCPRSIKISNRYNRERLQTGSF